jgi:capsular polysaccharide biosynthesis protein
MTAFSILKSIGLALLVTAVALAAAAVYTLRQPPVYRASMKIVLGVSDTHYQPVLGSASESDIQTMSDLVQSDSVASDVIKTLNLSINSTGLLKNLTVSNKPNTAVLDVAYDDTDRAEGMAILNAVGDAFTSRVKDQLTTLKLQLGAKPGIAAAVFDAAHSLPDPVKPKPLVNFGVAGGLGLVLGTLAAILMQQSAGNPKAEEPPSGNPKPKEPPLVWRSSG